VVDLVLLHGWGTHPLIWEPLLAKLPSDWKVHNLPLPGYAGSDSVSPYGLDELVGALASRLPERAVVVGWSLGGLAAMLMAARWPERIHRLVLIGATPCFVSRPDWPFAVAPDVFDGFAQSLARDYEDTLRRFLALQAQGSSSMREVLRTLRIRLLSLPRPSNLALSGGLKILQECDLRNVLPSMPINLVHGSGDRLAPIEAARWLANQSVGGHFLDIKGAGHAPFLSHPDEVAAFMTDVVNG
jgi:pimeloyl-[acyl-carrier protein] methyl ester esterase